MRPASAEGTVRGLCPRSPGRQLGAGTPRSGRSLGDRSADPPGWPGLGLGGREVALPAVERALGLAAAPVERSLPALGQLVVLAHCPYPGRRDVLVRAAGQGTHRGVVA